MLDPGGRGATGTVPLFNLLLIDTGFFGRLTLGGRWEQKGVQLENGGR